jgi:hypothetical protein
VHEELHTPAEHPYAPQSATTGAAHDPDPEQNEADEAWLASAQLAAPHEVDASGKTVQRSRS